MVNIRVILCVWTTSTWWVNESGGGGTGAEKVGKTHSIIRQRSQLISFNTDQTQCGCWKNEINEMSDVMMIGYRHHYARHWRGPVWVRVASWDKIRCRWWFSIDFRNNCTWEFRNNNWKNQFCQYLAVIKVFLVRWIGKFFEYLSTFLLVFHLLFCYRPNTSDLIENLVSDFLSSLISFEE